jgi:hypothetical protein
MLDCAVGGEFCRANQKCKKLGPTPIGSTTNTSLQSPTCNCDDQGGFIRGIRLKAEIAKLLSLVCITRSPDPIRPSAIRSTLEELNALHEIDECFLVVPKLARTIGPQQKIVIAPAPAKIDKKKLAIDVMRCPDDDRRCSDLGIGNFFNDWICEVVKGFFYFRSRRRIRIQFGTAHRINPDLYI